LVIPRIYLTGEIALECGDRLVTESALPGPQARLAFVFLVANRSRRVRRDELVEVIWPGQPPLEVDVAISAILSKLRGVLKRLACLAPEASIDVGSGSIGIRLPPRTWVDIEDAVNAIDEAEGAIRAGDWARAWGGANVVISITRRPFLQDREAGWIESHRVMLRTLLRRGLECLAVASHMTGEPSLAIQYTTDVLKLEPFRETAYQQLMRLHAASGNHAEALRVFEQCRRLLREELGASPSPQTEAVFLKILRAGE
jgi:SARP family transcriptional regulator, regulator of embCAB operon